MHDVNPMQRCTPHNLQPTSNLIAIMKQALFCLSLIATVAEASPFFLFFGRRVPDEITIKITNLSFQQPFGPFFVMTHNEEVPPLFTLGEASSPELGFLAENGGPDQLINLYSGMDGVGYITGFTDGFPYFGGDSLMITIPYDRDYPYVTLASMAINTNDCFVAINGERLMPGDVIMGPGYDSGTEENNELCSSIPGPACDMESGNSADGNGEGFVHVHRGFFGVGDLSEAGYDWRNPMVKYEVM